MSMLKSRATYKKSYKANLKKEVSRNSRLGIYIERYGLDVHLVRSLLRGFDSFPYFQICIDDTQGCSYLGGKGSCPPP